MSSAPSMAAAAASTFTSSSPLHTKISNFIAFTHSPPHPLPSLSFSKPFKLLIKPLKLTAAPLPHFRHVFAALDGSEVAQDEDVDDPLAETEENDEQEAFQEDDDGDDEDEVKRIELSEEGRLYVGNLPYTMTASELTEVFREAGSVANVEIIYDRNTDRSRGFGFVTMASVEEANEAIRMFNGSQVGGRTVRVNFPEVPKGGERKVMGPRVRNNNRGFIDSPYKIYAGNLGWGLTSQGLRDAFADQPGVLSAKVIYERDTGRSRGFGFVSFETAENAEAALKAMNGVEVEGRALRLNLATERAPSSPAPEGDTENNLQRSELLSGISV